MFDNFVVPDLLPAAPELFLAAMALAILMIDLLVKDSRRTVTFALTQLTLITLIIRLVRNRSTDAEPAAERPDERT